mmetsp:Transcript_22961/g.19923  ORF Transcript_22961/g.19923 Transcript_22961/m.19923 type:complete len:102 (-) Transcript_22961:164-469(-)
MAEDTDGADNASCNNQQGCFNIVTNCDGPCSNCQCCTQSGNITPMCQYKKNLGATGDQMNQSQTKCSGEFMCRNLVSGCEGDCGSCRCCDSDESFHNFCII